MISSFLANLRRKGIAYANPESKRNKAVLILLRKLYTEGAAGQSTLNFQGYQSQLCNWFEFLRIPLRTADEVPARGTLILILTSSTSLDYS